MAAEIKDKDLGWKRIQKNIADAGKGVGTTVGVQGAAAGKNRDGITEAELAAVHEFGSPSRNIPQRSFMRSTFDKKRQIYEKGIQGIVKKLFSAVAVDLKAAMRPVGNRYRSDVRDTMEAGISPALAVATIEKRRRAGLPDGPPLIATGELLSDITVEVKSR